MKKFIEAYRNVACTSLKVAMVYRQGNYFVVRKTFLAKNPQLNECIITTNY